MSVTEYGAIGTTELTGRDPTTTTTATTTTNREASLIDGEPDSKQNQYGSRTSSTKTTAGNATIHGEPNAGPSAKKPEDVSTNEESPAEARHVSFYRSETPPGRRVSFCGSTNCDREDTTPPARPSELSPSRTRNTTSSSVGYCTHSEAEECDEDTEISLVVSSLDPGPPHRTRRFGSFGSFSWSSQGRRRRAKTRHATVVSDTFVNECICCCAILWVFIIIIIIIIQRHAICVFVLLKTILLWVKKYIIFYIAKWVLKWGRQKNHFFWNYGFYSKQPVWKKFARKNIGSLVHQRAEMWVFEVQIASY